MNNCIDGDDTDYPLSYQFGIELKSNSNLYQRYLSFGLIPQIYISIPSGVTLVIGTACDSLNTCNSYNTSINPAGRRIQTILQEFKIAIEDTENIPASLIVYSMNNPDTTTLAFMYNQMYWYFINEYFNSASLDLFVSCLQSVFSVTNSVTADIVTNATYLVNSVLNNYANKLTDYQASTILSSLSQYLSNLSINNAKDMLTTVSNY